MLNQKQLVLASRLYIAASKSGHTFDLAKFSNDREYALQTLAHLMSEIHEGDTQPLIAETMLSFSEQVSLSPPPTASSPGNEPKPGEPAPKQYVGRLR